MDLSLAGRRPLSSLSTNGQDVEGQQQQQRAAQKLAALEKEVSEKVDKDFFVEEVLFRPLVHVIDVLGSKDGAVSNVSMEALQEQCALVNRAMESFVEENSSYLNGNVEAMGTILRKFQDTCSDVRTLRGQ
ncbi:hypothetical protein NGA_0210300, partial [Nannochloropsis gaditana CCMP526]